ncbi:MAG: uracil-DNA glycosylase family protein [Bacteroidales bacterium]
MSKNNEHQLDEIMNQVLNCTSCPLHKHRFNAVFGVGPYDSPVFIIGEAPGAKEDEAGEPFVGKAGKLLDELLEKYGLSRQKNVFISNIVKCRPPKNRVPAKKEVHTCFPYLEKQIDLINPAILILLGATALKSFTGSTEKITGLRGKCWKKNGRQIMPTYHPAAVFRNPAYRQFIEKDIKTLAEKYHALYS